MKLASQAGTPIYFIYPGNLNQILPVLQLDPDIKQFIAQEVNQGLFAITPQTNITLNQWTGIGFIVFNPNNGTGSYFISGGIGGLVQITNGGATSTGSPPLLGSSSLEPSIQASLNTLRQIDELCQSHE